MHKNHINRIIALLAAALCLMALPVCAFADDGVPVGNFGELDTQTDTGAGDDENTEAGSTLITMSNGFVYNTDDRKFYHTVGSGRFGINVPDNAITTGTVSVVADTSLTCHLYLNGMEKSDCDLSAISAPGKYVLAVAENDESSAVRVYFTIVNSITGEISEYKMPSDFYVVSAKLNGLNAVYSQSYVEMTSEGDYKIEYRSPRAGVDFTLEVTVDHTPPTLTLTGLTDNKANGPVTISEVEEGAQVFILRNEKPIAYKETLTDTGVYTVTVRDKAGNLTEYNFVIVAYLNANSWIFFAAFGVMVIGLAAYLIYKRKNMRVR